MGKFAAIVQARMGSSRLPGKPMMNICGKSLLTRTLERAKAIPDVDVVVLATTGSVEDRPLLVAAEELGVVGFAGSEDDVLDRYRMAAHAVHCDVILRLTGDCPLLDPMISHQVLRRFLKGGVDYVSNVHPPTYPDGLDTEVFTLEALEIAWRDATLKTEREHVTQYIVRNTERFRIENVTADEDMSSLRWTVDELEDLKFVRTVFQELARQDLDGYSYLQVLEIIRTREICDASSRFDRNEGLMRTMKVDGIS